MEFINMLVETRGSEEFKKESKKLLNYGTYEEMGFRMFDRLEIGNIGLSVQASCNHYCSPRKTLPLEKYATMELAIFKDDAFVSTDQITKNQTIIDKLKEYDEGTVYSFVPVDIIEELYQDIFNK